MKNQNLNKLFIIVLFLVGIFSSHTLKAQSEFGVKGGILYTGINRNFNGSVFNFEKRNGGVFGLYYKKYNVFGPIGFQAEFLYQMKGANYYIEHICSTELDENGLPDYWGYGDQSSGYWMKKPQRYHYLTIPLLLTYSPTNFLDIYAGPELGYMIANTSAKYTEWIPNRFSAGISAGIGFKIDNSTKLDIRYSNDLTRVADFGDTDIKNYGWAFTLQRTLFRK